MRLLFCILLTEVSGSNRRAHQAKHLQPVWRPHCQKVDASIAGEAECEQTAVQVSLGLPERDWFGGDGRDETLKRIENCEQLLEQFEEDVYKCVGGAEAGGAAGGGE